MQDDPELTWAVVVCIDYNARNFYFAAPVAGAAAIQIGRYLRTY